jgi:hypothetical protein
MVDPQKVSDQLDPEFLICCLQACLDRTCTRQAQVILDLSTGEDSAPLLATASWTSAVSLSNTDDNDFDIDKNYLL